MVSLEQCSAVTGTAKDAAVLLYGCCQFHNHCLFGEVKNIKNALILGRGVGAES